MACAPECTLSRSAYGASALPTVEPVPLPEAGATPQSTDPLWPYPSLQEKKILPHWSL